MDKEINAVIDKVAEKVGVAVEAAGPIAETVVREMAAAGLAGAIVGALSMALVAVTSVRVVNYILRQDYKEQIDRCGLAIAASCVGVALWIICLCCFASGLNQYLSPTLHAIEAIR